MSEPDSFTVTVPSRLRLGRRMYPLNLNLYRNAHYIVKAKLKDLFAETVKLYDTRTKSTRLEKSI